MNRGFTLVELMIVVAIVAILSTISYRGYSDLSATFGIRAAADSLSSGIASARAEAIKRNARVYFEVEVNTEAGRDQYIWYVGCVSPVEPPASSVASCPSEIKEGNLSVSQSIRVSLLDNGGAPASRLVFTSTGVVSIEEASGSPVNPLSLIEIRNNQNLGQPLNIMVAPGGSSKVCQPNITDPTDIRSC